MGKMMMSFFVCEPHTYEIDKKKCNTNEKMLSYNLSYNTYYLFNISDVKHILY